MLSCESSEGSLTLNPFRIYRMQPKPAIIVVFALGLCGTESSPYAEDLIRYLPKNVLIITVRGEETSGNHELDTKFFLKNDCSRVLGACYLAKKICPDCPIIGLGISLGGALILQAHQTNGGSVFHGIVLVSTSLWYEHALKTMTSTLKGRVANRLIAWWQFRSLYWTPNFLHSGAMRFWDWFAFFSSSPLDQDVILCKLYDMDYRAYLDSLDLRGHIQEHPRVYFLASYNDPMFSMEHMRETEVALKSSKVKYTLTEVGKHGDFTVEKRNDFLVQYVKECLTELVAKWMLLT